jgi:hypothetical protein
MVLEFDSFFISPNVTTLVGFMGALWYVHYKSARTKNQINLINTFLFDKKVQKTLI